MSANNTNTGSGGGFDPSGLISGGLTAIGNTLVGVKDAKERARISESLGKLSLQQQQELNREMQKAQSQNQRLALMIQASQRSQQNPYLYKIGKQKNILIGLSIFGVLTLAGMFIYLKYKKK